MNPDQIRAQIVIAYVTTFHRKPTDEEVEQKLRIICQKPLQFPINLASGLGLDKLTYWDGMKEKPVPKQHLFKPQDNNQQLLFEGE